MFENTVNSKPNSNERKGTRGEVIGWDTAQQAGRSHYSHGVDLTCNKYEYQEYFLMVKAAGI